MEVTFDQVLAKIGALTIERDMLQQERDLLLARVRELEGPMGDEIVGQPPVEDESAIDASLPAPTR